MPELETLLTMPASSSPVLLCYPVRSFHSALMSYRMMIIYFLIISSSWRISGLVSNDYQASFTLTNLILDSYLAAMVNGFHGNLTHCALQRSSWVKVGIPAQIFGIWVAWWVNPLAIRHCVTVWLTTVLVVWVSYWKMVLFTAERTHMERWRLPSCPYALNSRGSVRSRIHSGVEEFWKVFLAQRWFRFLLTIAEKCWFRWITCRLSSPPNPQSLDNYRVLNDVEKLLRVNFLQSMLRLKPVDRASAAELLEHEWIKLSSWVIYSINPRLAEYLPAYEAIKYLFHK